MMQQQGLAAQAAPQEQMMRDLDQVVQMIKQGVTPEELLQMGVPEQLIMAAMEVIGQQANAVPQGQEGLAGMQVPQPGM